MNTQRLYDAFKIYKIEQECKKLKEENEQLKKKLKKSTNFISSNYNNDIDLTQYPPQAF